jgi:uncharacterized protein YmfQ (DUF2313 family)
MSANPIYSSSDYQSALLGLLPPGRAWAEDPASVQGCVALSLAQGFARLDARAQQLLVDAFPPTTVEMLPEWESALGLPDPCAGESPILSQRQTQVVARLTDTGGQSPDRFTAFAAQLGFDITITEFAPARFGATAFGDPWCGEVWAYVWQVNAPTNTTAFSTYGGAAFGDPYSAWGNAALECEMNARAPAHTLLLFHYTE